MLAKSNRFVLEAKEIQEGNDVSHWTRRSMLRHWKDSYPFFSTLLTIPMQKIFACHYTHTGQPHSSLLRFSLTALIWDIPSNNNGMVFANWKIADSIRSSMLYSSTLFAIASLALSNQLKIYGSAVYSSVFPVLFLQLYCDYCNTVGHYSAKRNSANEGSFWFTLRNVSRLLLFISINM
jgi:hypothetical protein